VTSWSQWRRGRFWAEVVLAVVVGVAAFVVAAVVSTVARSHVPAALLGLLLLLVVLAVARFAGILYALPVGAVAIVAFDWYFLPPLRNLDGDTVPVLGLLLAVSVIVGAFATQAGRRAAGSEQARGVLAEEQAALRRVATLVARQPSPAEVFAAVTEETARTARLLHIDSAHLIVYERDQTATVVGSWNLRGPPMPVGTRVPMEGDNIIGRVFRTRQPARIDDYGHASGLAAENVRAIGVRAAVGVPVIVGGRLWGVMAVGSSGQEPLPAGTEMRIGAFTELMATAIANSDARAEIERLAEEQAALRHVATLVARGAETDEVFAAVAREVAEVMHLPVAAVQRYEDDETTTVTAAWSDRAHPFQPGTRWPYHPSGLAGRVRQTGRAGRVNDYSNRRGAFAARAREVGLRSVAGAPIIVDGAVWGLMTIASTDGALPDTTEDRLAEFTELVGTAIANAQSRTELSASRARIIAATDDTRRRIERDLHDGIQQRLVSLALRAQMIETMTPPPADQIQGELSRLASGLGTALDELREISHGIHPALLSESGLGPALEALARRSAVPVELDLNLGPRLDKHIEAAGYYIASEAITNAAKYARASVIDVCADARDGALTLSISDDGVGGADPSRGSGIIGLRDRVEALSGTILVLSPPGQGTTLHVQLPADPMATSTRPGGTPTAAAGRAGRRVLTRGSAGCASWSAAIDDPANRIRRQLLLWQEPCCRAFGDRTREIGRRVGRDQNDGRPAITVVGGQTPGKLKPALSPEHDVHQDNLRPELLCSPQCLS
jgi:signal transduction histidine kinase